MTLSNDRFDKQKRQEQSRAQKVVMYSIFTVAGVLLTVAIVLIIVNGVKLF